MDEIAKLIIASASAGAGGSIIWLLFRVLFPYFRELLKYRKEELAASDDRAMKAVQQAADQRRQDQLLAINLYQPLMGELKINLQELKDELTIVYNKYIESETKRAKIEALVDILDKEAKKVPLMEKQIAQLKEEVEQLQSLLRERGMDNAR